jgi:D-alanyl-D-alanine dipeptidase
MKFYKAILMLLFATSVLAGIVPSRFVDLKKTVPSLVIELRYYDKNNFIGQRIDGYEAPICYLSISAAEALKAVQEELFPFGLGLKVFDAYRPQRAVNHFVRWAKDLNDTKMKEDYYPDVQKSDLFEKGCKKRSHSATCDVFIRPPMTVAFGH